MSNKFSNQNLKAPFRLNNIPQNSQWLSGEGAGSWFHLTASQGNYLINRYSPMGKIECGGIFEITNHIPFDLKRIYEFTYLSHCKSVTLLQDDKIIVMTRISTF